MGMKLIYPLEIKKAMIKIKGFQCNPVMENTYILYNQTQAILIDPGCLSDEEKSTIADFIQENKLKPEKIVCTHCHPDHIFGAQWAYEKYGTEMYVDRMEADSITVAQQMASNWGIEFKAYNGPFHYLTEGDSIYLAEEVLEVLNLAGHSIGGLGFLNRTEGFLLSGDALFRESIGRTDLPGGDYPLLLKNLKEKVLVLPDETRVFSGHGPETTIKHEKEFNTYLK